MYLENLLYSAEIKYLASCLLTSVVMEDIEKRRNESKKISNKNTIHGNEMCRLDSDFSQMKTNVSGIEKDLGPTFLPESDCKTSVELGSETGIIFDLMEDPMRAYCLRLRSSCLANAALCRSHRNFCTRTNTSKNERTFVGAVSTCVNDKELAVDRDFESISSQPQSLSPSPSLFLCENTVTSDTHVDKVSNFLPENISGITKPTVESKPTIACKNSQWNNSQNYLSCDVLANMSAIELINASFCVPENILLRSRKIVILERQHK